MRAVPLVMALPLIIAGALLIAYCWYDLARTKRSLYLRKWQWAVAVLILLPIGPIAYLLFEKLGLNQVPGTPSEELSEAGGNLHVREH